MKKIGRYDIVSVCGKGAMGLVYKAHDPNIDRTVAIKTVLVQHLSGEQASEYEFRFRAEARAAGKLQHPNIVGVYDAGRDAGMAYIVMEFIDGEDLAQARDRGEKFSLDRTVTIVTQLLAALNYAHQNGVVHRDIKPANVMLDRGGRVKLSDFGVARITESGDATRTQGSMVGTLKYMSPEQVQGQRDIDHRSDLFAVGVLLYEMVTGHKPFDGPSDFAISTAIVMQDPKLPSSQNPALPAAYDAVIMKALAKDRGQRYTTARDFAMALRPLGRGGDQQGRSSVHEGTDVASSPFMGTVNRHGGATVGAASPGTAEAGTSATVGTKASAGTSGTAGVTATAVSQEMELVYWKEIQDSNDPADFIDFVRAFPNGTFVGRAHRRLRMLSPGDHSQASFVTHGTAPSSPTSLPQPFSASAQDATMPPLSSESARADSDPARLRDEQEAHEALELARRDREAREASEKARKAQEAAERARKEQQERDAAEQARKAQEARAAREAEERERQLREQKAREAQEAAERARKEQQEREAADQARKAQEARAAREAEERERQLREQKAREAQEAAERARKEQQEREAAEQARKAQEARAAREVEERERQLREQKAREAQEAAERARKEQQEREAAEQARKAQEARAAREAEERERQLREQKAREAQEAAERARKEQQEREAAEQARKAQEARQVAHALETGAADDATRLGRPSQVATTPVTGEDATRLAGSAFKPGMATGTTSTAPPFADPLALLKESTVSPIGSEAVASSLAATPRATTTSTRPTSTSVAPPKSKAGLIVGGTIAVMVLAGIAIMMGRGDPKPTSSASPSAPLSATTPMQAPQPEEAEKTAASQATNGKGADKAAEAERARQETEAREATQRAAREKTERDAAAKISQDKTARDKAADKAAAEKAAADKAAAERAAAERAAAERAAADKAAADKAAADKAAADKAAAERAAADKAAADKAAADKAAADKAAADKAAAERAAAERAAAEKAAAEKAAAERAAKAKEEASPAFQLQRAQDLEKAGQMRPAKAAYERAAEGGSAVAAKRRWEIAVSEKAPADETARWQRRAFQLGAPGVPEPKGPAALR